MSNKASVIENLTQVLANSYSLYLKTQNYHWNVTGPNFKPLHLLFEEQYNDLALAIDVIAERIRTLGAKAPGTWPAYAKLSQINDGNENNPAATMVSELAEDQARLVKVLKQALQSAQAIEDEATIDLLVGRIGIHEKNAWMLHSSM